jgi:hypothetical protein
VENSTVRDQDNVEKTCNGILGAGAEAILEITLDLPSIKEFHFTGKIVRGEFLYAPQEGTCSEIGVVKN